MARPLTDISEERIKEYEKQLEAALEKKNYQRAKEIKRLFRVYIERRGYKIDDYKEHSIYNKYYYEHRQPRREISKAIIKYLENELREYEVMSNIKINEGQIIYSQLPIEKQEQLRELETARYSLNYSINKKYKMREYRKKLYVIKRINEMLNDGKDYTDFVKDYFDTIENLKFNDKILNKVFKAIKIYKKEYEKRLKQNIKKMIITKGKKEEYIIERLTEEMDDDYNYADAVNNYYKNPNSLIKELREGIEMAIEIFGKEYEEKREAANNPKRKYIIEKLNKMMNDGTDYTNYVNSYYTNPNSLKEEMREALKDVIEVFGKEYNDKIKKRNERQKKIQGKEKCQK